MMRIGVLISGGGTNLQALIDGIESGYIPGEIAVVISNRSTAYGLERARMHGIPAKCILKKDYNNDQAFNAAILETLKEHNVELVVLAGYLSILSPDVVKAYPNRIINIHPSLIPAFCGKGYYGQKVHRAVLEYGVKVTGATVHFVDEGTDTGPIILQQPVMVKDDDDINSLAQRVLEVEHQLLCRAVKLFIEGRITVRGRKVSINE
ncbi:MAG: phosphoribosylglycinamide formyltransferase [Clostridiales bacterium]|mgnify:FL=1|nr:phosphoribosylglycinamide formyltransferase [Clostridiales bacterium]